jgi:16S rRNA (cytidine1402-2'-O)-methyltransferase
LGTVRIAAVEDTRVTSRLLARHGLRPTLISHRAPVEGRSLGRLLDALESEDIALVSDAGTPTLSDPGQRLIDAAWKNGHRVIPIPGPSAITAALAVAGFPGPGFTFVGFLPRKPSHLRALFESIRDQERLTVAFDSPYRILKSLAVLNAVLPERQVAVGREMTKIHEEVIRGTAAEVVAAIGARNRGEFTLVIAGSKP